MLKPRKGFTQYTPEDFNTRGKRALAGSSRMASLEDDDVNDEEEEVPVARPTRKKITSKRGRGGNTTR